MIKQTSGELVIFDYPNTGKPKRYFWNGVRISHEKARDMHRGAEVSCAWVKTRKDGSVVSGRFLKKGF